LYDKSYFKYLYDDSLLVRTMPKVAPEYKQLARQRILEAAMRVFSEKGYRESTMDDVAEVLGVSKAALYRYFESKEELFRAIIEMIGDAAKQSIRASFKGRRFDPADFFTTIGQRIWSPRLFLNALSESFRDPALRGLLRKGYSDGVSVISEFVEEQKANGTFRQDVDTHLLAMGMLALHDGLLDSAAAGVKDELRQRVLGEVMNVMLQGLLAK
jgi:AcrR family transcriptional regulator